MNGYGYWFQSIILIFLSVIKKKFLKQPLYLHLSYHSPPDTHRFMAKLLQQALLAKYFHFSVWPFG